MTNSKALLGIAILGAALGGGCSDNGTRVQGSGGSAGGSGGASVTGGDQGTSAGANGGGATAGNSGSGGAVASGGSIGNGGATSTGGATGVGGNTSGGQIDSGSTATIGGASGGNGGATESTTVATGGATGGKTAAGGRTASTGGTTGGAPGGTKATGGGTGGKGGATSTGGTTGTDGATGGASGGTGGATGGTNGNTSGATGGASGGTGGAAGTGALPALHVDGKFVKDPTGKTIVLRGYALIDIGALYQQTNSTTGITGRIDAIAAAGFDAHMVRMPVYPRTDFNGGQSYYSGLPYPVGTAAPAGQKVTVMTGPDYISKVLKPAIDYATSKNMYAIIDLHQIDDTNTAHNSGADATSFWTDIAPQFKDYSNVIYELYNEPINSGMAWATFKTQVQTWIDTVRAAAPNNLIIVPSMSWDQHPGDAASSPPNGTNLVYTAHIYPNNWGASFQQQLATATGKAPVFITEWGYSSPQTAANWGDAFQTTVDGDGANWTAWVADNSWGPAMFSNSGLTTLTDFGTLVKNWLAAKVAQDWVQ
jgi:hypothetical protein